MYIFLNSCFPPPRLPANRKTIDKQLTTWKNVANPTACNATLFRFIVYCMLLHRTSDAPGQACVRAGPNDRHSNVLWERECCRSCSEFANLTSFLIQYHWPMSFHELMWASETERLILRTLPPKLTWDNCLISIGYIKYLSDMSDILDILYIQETYLL